MKMKIIGIVLIIVLFTGLIAVTLFADENDNEKESVTLSGKILVENRRFPELQSGNDTYYLMIHNFIEVKNDDNVVVEGYIYDISNMPIGHYFKSDEDKKHVFVTKLTVNGKEYDLGDYECGNCGDNRNYKNGRKSFRGHGRGIM